MVMVLIVIMMVVIVIIMVMTVMVVIVIPDPSLPPLFLFRLHRPSHNCNFNYICFLSQLSVGPGVTQVTDWSGVRPASVASTRANTLGWSVRQCSPLSLVQVQ